MRRKPAICAGLRRKVGWSQGAAKVRLLMARTRAVVVAILIAATSVSGWWLGRHGPGAPTDSATGSRFAAHVTETVDGDTVRVQTARGPDTVRLLGINTPNR